MKKQDYRLSLQNNQPPCNGCTTRYQGCHSQCIKYIDWKQKRQVLLDKKNADSRLNDSIVDIRYQKQRDYYLLYLLYRLDVILKLAL